jgi:hypothetical protein
LDSRFSIAARSCLKENRDVTEKPASGPCGCGAARLRVGPDYAADATRSGRSNGHDHISNRRTFRNPAGRAGTFSTQGSIDLTSEFFNPQGTNGRSCASCHIPEDAWSINPGTLQQLFDETDGTHPVFNSRRRWIRAPCSRQGRG